MKKHKLFSLAAICAAMLTPCGLTAVPGVMAQSEQAQDVLPTASEFIDAYCKIERVTLLPDGKEQSEFIWIESITPENLDLVCEGREIFDRLDESAKQTIIQACKARNVDYPALSASALEQKAQQEANAKAEQEAAGKADPETKPVESEKKPEQKPEESAPKDSSASSAEDSQENSSSDSSSSETEKKPEPEQTDQKQPDSSQQNSQKPGNEPEKDKETAGREDQSETSSETSEKDEKQPETAVDAKPEQKPADSAETEDNKETEPEEPAVQPVPSRPVLSAPDFGVPFNPGTVPAGLTCTPADAPVTDTLYQCAALIAKKAGMDSWVVKPVIYTYAAGDLNISSAPYYFVQNPQQTVIFRIISEDEQKVTVQFFSDDSCTFDASTSGLMLSARSEADFTWQSQPAAQPIESEKAAVQTPQTDAPKADQPEAKSDLLASAPAAQAQKPAGQNIGGTLDEAAQNFINRYCYVQGGLIRQAGTSNYQQILNGLRSWEALSPSSKGAVNAYLIAQGGTSYQMLYRQANQARLGLPITSRLAQAQPGTGKAASVQTGAAEDFAWWISSFTASFEAMFFMAMRPKKKD